ncbi:hypothetical protein [Streptomyces sp. SID161]|uniref:hypothetical protein n=1 Tax=Streptomyces sp. SID161 TaxID=2690251 RepID=UPI00136C8BD1|nr:hypothetical protein [Streptomyces sp. SID161]MYW45032.1 hypothetical protein [Streptomyces sp. SID161]
MRAPGHGDVSGECPRRPCGAEGARTIPGEVEDVPLLDVTSSSPAPASRRRPG